MLYPVNDCYVCVQGEGSLTGMAMVLLRLHGCDVGCPWCDTKETWAFESVLEQASLADALGTDGKFARLSADAILSHIQTHAAGPKWILITGGEPAQYDLKSLVTTLQVAGYKCAIETSGTEVGHMDAGIDWVCVSPKIDMPGGKEVLPETWETADEIKFVVGKQSDIDVLDSWLDRVTLKPTAEICLQPISVSEKATKICLDTVQARGWRLSIQTHKLIGVR